MSLAAVTGPAGPEWELDVLVTKRLEAHAVLLGRVHYLRAATDTDLPYLVVYRHDGGPGEFGSFDGAQRNYTYVVRAAARSRQHAAILCTAALSQLVGYTFPDLDGWHQLGPAEWEGMVPSPGNLLPDRTVVYYEGAQIAVRLEETPSGE